MKRIALFGLVCLILVSCEKKAEEAPNEIPGMGNSTEALEVTAYDLPEGIEIVGDITGFEEEAIAALPENSLKSASKIDCSNENWYGSGGNWVRIKITLQNTSGRNRTVFLPKGLVFQVDKSDYQHALLLQWVWFNLKPKSTRTIYLNLYCINKGKNGSDINSYYKLLGITKSKLIWELLNIIAWKKINFEHYPCSVLKSANIEEVDYPGIVDNLQDAVWALTNGKGLTNEHITFIESLPELEPGTYPENLDKQPFSLPEFFEEYTPE
jgi:hypothetical protein